MKQNLLKVVSGVFLYFLDTTSLTFAQIVPDATLLENSNVEVQGTNSVIFGGTRAGNNLFHSFEQFSVPTNRTVYFNNALDVQNIIGRVTGRSISNIDGLIKANGNANLFLINPNGFIFGRNARLNIGGSFLAGSANSINFADGTHFGANTQTTSPLLTISVPIGLNFGKNPGTVQVQGTGYMLRNQTSSFLPFVGAGSSSTGLRVRPGKTLALVGGNVILNGGILTAPGGKIELGSVNNEMVSINQTSQGSTLSYEGLKNFQDIQLSQKALIDTSGVSAGSIQLKGANISLTNGSIILIQNQGSKPSGTINLIASGLVDLNGTSSDGTISTGIVSETLGGNGSNIGVSAKSLILENGAQLVARTFRTGQGGSLTINTSDSIQVLGSSSHPPLIPSSIVTATFGTGNGGTLNLSTQNLTIQKGAIAIAGTFGAGKGGDLNVSSSNSINLSGYIPNTSTVSSSLLTETNGFGNGGNFVLQTKNLTLQEGAVLGSLTFQSGLGGNTIVNAGKIEVTGNNPASFLPSVINAATFGSGNGGNLTISTSQLVVAAGGRVDTTTLANGKAGNLTINASDFVDISGTVPGSVNPSLIDSSGNILDEKLQQFYHLPPKPSGDSGDLNISTRKLSVTNGANVSVQNQGSGKAGTLTVNATSLTLDRGGSLTATTTTRDGGNIKLNAGNILLRHAGNVSATAGNNGNGGNITIDTGTLTLLEKSNITANAFEGRGGNIQIAAQGIFRSPNSNITASSKLGINGTVRINTLDTNPNLAISNPVGFPQTPLVASACQRGSGVAANQFIITGTGGIPPSPSDLQYSHKGWEDDSLPIQATQNSKESESSTSSEFTQIVAAQGWRRNPDGTVTLIAEPDEATPYSSASLPPCTQASASQVTAIAQKRSQGK